MPQPSHAIAAAQCLVFYVPQYAEIRRAIILAEFNGANHDELARKYHLTPRFIGWLVTQSRTDASAEPSAEIHQGPIRALALTIVQADRQLLDSDISAESRSQDPALTPGDKQ